MFNFIQLQYIMGKISAEQVNTLAEKDVISDEERDAVLLDGEAH